MERSWNGQLELVLSVIVSPVIVYAIFDLRSSPDHPLGETRSRSPLASLVIVAPARLAVR